ncbi:hypothetical protein AAFF_G00168250 [Aldrovandia affinis]|uniref:Uncharacterized protein n=1 Tax=Aldrovandia affinis TaxID=143900 RepID=A0AAD7W7U8_9TELE|nr:hypothetical protein AAFF_G00168250 [Aldrovandia affinis]
MLMLPKALQMPQVILASYTLFSIHREMVNLTGARQESKGKSVKLLRYQAAAVREALIETHIRPSEQTDEPDALILGDSAIRNIKASAVDAS